MICAPELDIRHSMDRDTHIPVVAPIHTSTELASAGVALGGHAHVGRGGGGLCGVLGARFDGGGAVGVWE